MKRTTWMWLQIALTWIAFGALVVSREAKADVLVRSYPSAESTAFIWQLPKDAQLVRRIRGADIAVVPVSDLLPTDRVASCDDPLVLAGSAAKCTTTLPDGTNWRRVSLLFPTTPPPPVDDGKGYLRVTVNSGAAPMKWSDGTPIPSNAGIWLRLYEGNELIESVPWAPRLSVIRTYADRSRQVCFSSSVFIDVNRNGTVEAPLVIDEISYYEEAGRSADACKEPEPLFQMTVLTPSAVPPPVLERVRADEVPKGVP